MSKKAQILAALGLGMALSAQAGTSHPYTNQRKDLNELAQIKMTQLALLSNNGPIFIPRKHTKMKYADHKRMKAKRKNKR